MQRKVDHVNLALAQPVDQDVFSDFCLVHNCMPNASIEEVNLEVDLLGLPCGAPVYINAMTGGHGAAEGLNSILGSLARRFSLPVAVGSQSAALRDSSLIPTFTSIRTHNPNGPVWANISAGATLPCIQSAVDMIGASAVQLHLNAPQEAVQREGDKDFRLWEENIAAACSQLSVPVIAKEVGFGMAREEVAKLVLTGVSAVDCSGRGGTDFLQIEQQRYPDLCPPLSGVKWGIPTPLAVLESWASAKDVPVFASGGIHSALQGVICLALGAKAVGLGRGLLTVVSRTGEAGGIEYLERFLEDMRILIALQGCRTPVELTKRPVIVGGFSRDWILQRQLIMPHA